MTDTTNAIEPVSRVRSVRTRLGVSQQTMAHMMGCSLASVRLYEYGAAPQDVRFVAALDQLEELADSGMGLDGLPLGG